MFTIAGGILIAVAAIILLPLLLGNIGRILSSIITIVAVVFVLAALAGGA